MFRFSLHKIFLLTQLLSLSILTKYDIETTFFLWFHNFGVVHKSVNIRLSNHS
jgi:hypothetical protein